VEAEANVLTDGVVDDLRRTCGARERDNDQARTRGGARDLLAHAAVATLASNRRFCIA
jgi:hypothetical protein